MVEDTKGTGSGTLSRYRVLDLADAKGDFCTKSLADLGAEVIKIEPPGGHPTRLIPPFAGDIPDPDRSLYFLFRNLNKRGVTLSLESEEGRDLFRRLVATADVLVETFEPGYLDGLGLGYHALREINPGLIMASITEFGQSGPRAHYQGAPIVALAMSGAMQVAGFADKAPCNAPNAMAYDIASTYAGTGIMLALYGRGESGEGQYLDISVQEAGIAGLLPWAVPMTSYGTVLGGLDHPVRGGLGLGTYRCGDGYVRVASNVPRHWDALKSLIGEPEELADEIWEDPLFRRENQDVLKALVEGLLEDRTMTELFNTGQALGLPITPLQPVSGFASDPQPHGRGFFPEIQHPVAGAAKYATVPYKMSETPFNSWRPAPLLGQHNEAIYCDGLGISTDELTALRARGVV